MTSSTELRFADEAVEDLRSILQYTIETWGHDQGEAYREILREGFERLRTFPGTGRPSATNPRLRELIVGRHIIVYRHDEAGSTVFIARIVSQRQSRRR
jgi:plasmid stabilization system protein ParE